MTDGMGYNRSVLIEAIRGGSEDRRAGWVLRFRYEAGLVEALKKSVPHTDREWREEDKSWWVATEHEGVLERLFANFHSLAYDQMKMF